MRREVEPLSALHESALAKFTDASAELEKQLAAVTSLEDPRLTTWVLKLDATGRMTANGLFWPK